MDVCLQLGFRISCLPIQKLVLTRQWLASQDVIICLAIILFVIRSKGHYNKPSSEKSKSSWYFSGSSTLPSSGARDIIANVKFNISSSALFSPEIWSEWCLDKARTNWMTKLQNDEKKLWQKDRWKKDNEKKQNTNRQTDKKTMTQRLVNFQSLKDA